MNVFISSINKVNNIREWDGTNSKAWFIVFSWYINITLLSRFFFNFSNIEISSIDSIVQLQQIGLIRNIYLFPDEFPWPIPRFSIVKKKKLYHTKSQNVKSKLRLQTYGCHSLNECVNSLDECFQSCHLAPRRCTILCIRYFEMRPALKNSHLLEICGNITSSTGLACCTSFCESLDFSLELLIIACKFTGSGFANSS